jgi:hypothetical protein
MTTYKLFALAAPALLFVASGLTIRDLSFRGTFEPLAQHLNATIVTAVHTPFGKLPVGGRVDATYACDGTLQGKVSYSSVILFLARLKGVTLVTSVQASIGVSPEWDCATVPDSITARFVVRDTVVSGKVQFGDRTAELTGVVKDNSGVYDLLLVAVREGRLDTARVVMR